MSDKQRDCQVDCQPSTDCQLGEQAVGGGIVRADRLSYMQTDCQAARYDVRQADMLSGRKTDCKAGTQSVKRTDILSSG
jgi:hypothetical protein